MKKARLRPSQRSMINKRLLSVSQGADELGISEEEFLKELGES